MLLPETYLGIYWHCISIAIALRRFLRNLDMFDRDHCLTCETACSFPIQDDIRTARDGIVSILDKQRSVPLLSPVIYMLNSFIGKLDDKLENYALAGDTEIKDLITSISNKLGS